MTTAQRRVLNFIKKFVADKGCNPKTGDLMRGLDCSSAGSVHKHVAALRKAGYLNPDTREIELLPRGVMALRDEEHGDYCCGYHVLKQELERVQSELREIRGMLSREKVSHAA